MTKEKNRPGLSAIGNGAKQRHEKAFRQEKHALAQRHDRRIWGQLNALKEPPKMKHKSYFEAVENTDKKKKLEYEITTDTKPPPGFEFVPTGHPELTMACKELSREQGCLIFIVSESKDQTALEHHMHRAGYHFRQTIVDQARKEIQKSGQDPGKFHIPGQLEPIPEDQNALYWQADAVLRDLFPRIPHTDRAEIILHAFNKNSKGERKVGLASELPLARRVQLAALAHIRHTHTRYDQLLKETKWENARKAVEGPCLNVIVKWRGDEETGRDQLDEILREVIEISDSEDDNESDTQDFPNRKSNETTNLPQPESSRPSVLTLRNTDGADGRNGLKPAAKTGSTSPGQQRRAHQERRALKKSQQRLRRYAAVAESFAHGENENSHSQEQHGHQGHQEHHRLPVLEGTAVLSQNRGHNSGTYAAQSQPMRHAPDDDVHIVDERFHGLGPTSAPMLVYTSRARSPPSGQSPILVRARDGNQPKVGTSTDGGLSSTMNGTSQDHMDHVMPSVEPCSPEHARFPRPPGHPGEAPRLISRLNAHEPVGYDRRSGSPRFFVRADRPSNSYPAVQEINHHNTISGAPAQQVRANLVQDYRPARAQVVYQPRLPNREAFRRPVYRARSPVFFLGERPCVQGQNHVSKIQEPIFVKASHPAEASGKAREAPTRVVAENSAQHLPESIRYLSAQAGDRPAEQARLVYVDTPPLPRRYATSSYYEGGPIYVHPSDHRTYQMAVAPASHRGHQVDDQRVHDGMRLKPMEEPGQPMWGPDADSHGAHSVVPRGRPFCPPVSQPHEEFVCARDSQHDTQLGRQALKPYYA